MDIKEYLTSNMFDSNIESKLQEFLNQYSETPNLNSNTTIEVYFNTKLSNLPDNL